MASAMILRFLSTTIKLLLASLVVGVALAFLDIAPREVFKDIGLTPEDVVNYLDRGVSWAVPHVILGAIVTVPVWLIVHMFRPPKN